MNKEVKEFVLGYKQTGQFLEKLEDMITFLIPHYIEEGKNQLIIAIGCTGGKHRSVTIAEELGNFLKEKNFSFTVATSAPKVNIDFYTKEKPLRGTGFYGFFV